MVRTDYDRPGFASRFQSARALDPETTRIWVRELGRRAPADDGICVDIGAGTGRFRAVLDQAWHPRAIVALDRSTEMLKRAPRSPGLAPVVADLDQLPLGDGVAQACFCSMVLHYSEDATAFCRRLNTILLPAGVLAIRTGTEQTLRSFLFLTCFPTAEAAELRAMPGSAGQVVALVQNAGFVEVEAIEVLARPYLGYRSYLTRVATRGFPSLQLVSRREFGWGLLRLLVLCLCRFLRARPVPAESSLLVIGRKE